MNIHISIPRPFLTLFILALGFSGFAWINQHPAEAFELLPSWAVIGEAPSVEPEPSEEVAEPVDAEIDHEHDHADVRKASGGDEQHEGLKIREREKALIEARSLRDVLDRKEELIRYQLNLLEEEQDAMGDDMDSAKAEELRERVIALNSLFEDQRKAEQWILTSFQQIFVGKGEELDIGDIDVPRFIWPVQPKYGISAHFKDKEYKNIFQFDHYAVDIPTEKGTKIRAPAGGIVSTVSDQNGQGYNYIIVAHGGGISTLYGHILESLVNEGDRVFIGDEIAVTNGEPGGIGTGAFSTGPHLHFEVRINNVPVDPEKYLPPLKGVEDEETGD